MMNIAVHKEKLILHFIIAVMMFALIAQPVLAKGGFSRAIGKQSVELLLPDGQCVMDQAIPQDASFLNTIRGVFARSHNVLMAFADCVEQKNWRTGKQKYLDSFGQFITPLAMLGNDMKMRRGSFAKQVCQQVKKVQGRQMDKLLSDMQKRMEKFTEGARFNEMKTLTGGYSDENACYFPTQQNIDTPDGKTKTLLGVSAMTLINGKLVQLNLYDRLKDENTLATLFDQQKVNITGLLALPGNQ